VSFIFGIFVYLGTRAVDLFNRLLMLGMITTYILLVILGAPHVKAENLQHKDWSYATLVLPILIISFGFHNMIPSLTSYLNNDVKRLRMTIISGSAFALAIYVVWEWLILGLVPFQPNEGMREILQEGDMATEILKSAVGASWVVNVAQYFAFFAILTSFLGNSLSFVDFLADGIKIKKTPIGKFWLCILVIAPPFLMAMIYPHIFLTALNYAGAFGAMTLFGILPALMVWSGRYHKHLGMKPIVPGGRIVLALIIFFALFVMSLQFTSKL
jgi:tyrosine-specific transport protein